MISGNMQATIGEATEPLVIEKKEEDGKSLALQELLKMLRDQEKTLRDQERMLRDQEKRFDERLRAHDEFIVHSTFEKIPITGRIIIDSIILQIDPTMESKTLDRAAFFAENGQDFLNKADIPLDDVIATVREVMSAAGASVHTVPLKTALQHLSVCKKHSKEHLMLGGVTAKTLEILEKLLVHLTKGMDEKDDSLDGTFADWKKSQKNREGRTRARAALILEQRTKEENARREFEDCGFSFE